MMSRQQDKTCYDPEQQPTERAGNAQTFRPEATDLRRASMHKNSTPTQPKPVTMTFVRTIANDISDLIPGTIREVDHVITHEAIIAYTGPEPEDEDEIADTIHIFFDTPKQRERVLRLIHRVLTDRQEAAS